MRILIAPDSFKGSLTSTQAAVAMADGIRAVRSDVEIIMMPLADGGEGTRGVYQRLYGGEVHDDVLYFDDEGRSCALIESAALIGLSLVAMQGDLFERGSAALGKALLSVLDTETKDIRITLGGSATIDGGLGLLMALGCRVLDGDGVPVSADLNGLMQARKIETTDLNKRLKDVSITLLLDVENPLCGQAGAVCMYGAQKGLKAAQVQSVELAMRQWGMLCEQVFAVSVQSATGAGAAGGVGFALRLLGKQCDVKAVSGAEEVMKASGFEQITKTVDWVITGEGRSDAQTLHGKLPSVVAQQARVSGVAVALISGDLCDATLLQHQFDSLLAARPKGMSISEAIDQAEVLVTAAAARWARSIR